MKGFMYHKMIESIPSGAKSNLDFSEDKQNLE